MMIGVIVICLIVLFLFYDYLRNKGTGDGHSGNGPSEGGNNGGKHPGGVFIPPEEAYRYFIAANRPVWIRRMTNTKCRIYTQSFTDDVPETFRHSDRYGTYIVLFGDSNASIEIQLDDYFKK